MKKHLYSVAFIIGLSLVSCGPPVDPEAVIRQKVADTLSQLDAMKGTYGGTLVTKRSNEPMGVATLQLSSGSEIYTSPTESKSQLRTVLRATLELQLPEKKLTITFNESYFDPERHQFRVGFNPMLADPRLHLQSRTGFVLTGTLSGDTITGEMSADGYAEEGVKFSFKNGATLSALSQSILSHPKQSAEFELERDYVSGRGANTHVVMSARSVSNELELFRMLTPYQWLEVSYFFGLDTPILFSDAKWDARTRQLTGITKSSNPMTSLIVTHYLDCLAAPEAKISGRLGLPESLDCTVRSSNRGVINQFTLSASK